MTGTSSAFHITQVEEIKRIVGEAMYESEVIGPDGSPVSGGISETMGALGLRPLNLSAVGNSIVIGSGIGGKPPFALQMPPKSRGKLRFLGNYAVGGAKSAQIISSQLSNVPAETDVLLEMEGVNDAGIANPLPVYDHIANLDTICNWAIARGITPLIVETPPNSWVASDKTTMERYKLAERVYCEDHGIPFAAPWDKYKDPDGTWVDAVAGDGTHPTLIVHNWAANEILAQFVAREPAMLQPYSETDQAGIIKTNALLGSGVTTPTNWTVGGVTSSAMSAATYPVMGRWSEHTCTSVAAGTNNVYRSLGNPLLYGNVGDTLRIVGWFKFAPSSNMSLAVRLQITASPANHSTWLFDTSIGFDETYFSAECTIPSGTTGNSYIFVQHSNTSSGEYSGTFGFAAVQIFNITQYRFFTVG